MSDLFPPISEAGRINTRFEPPKPSEVTVRTDQVRRVFKDKEIIDTYELTTYDRNGNIKTLVQSSQQIVDFIV